MNRRQCAALVAGLALARPGSAQDRAVVRWKLATGYRAETFHGRNLAQFAAEAAQATEGALAIELHANGALYKLADIWPACEQGQLDAGLTYALNENCQLDLGCNFGITRSAPDYQPFVGVSRRF